MPADIRICFAVSRKNVMIILIGMYERKGDSYESNSSKRQSP